MLDIFGLLITIFMFKLFEQLKKIPILKKIPPIYIDDNSREEYYSSLSKIDLEGNYLPFILLVEKRIINTMIPSYGKPKPNESKVS